MSNLYQAAQDFGIAYTKSKQAAATASERQSDFFKAIDEHLETQLRPQMIVPLHGDLGHTLKMHRGWRLVKVNEQDDTALLEQDPHLMKFSVVHPDTKMVYGRTINQASPSLDDALLQETDPALWERVTTWPEPWASLVATTVRSLIATKWSQATVDAKVDSLLREQNVQRVLRADLSESDWEDLDPYLVPGAISTRILVPRAAKPEELETDEEPESDNE